jgi:sulfite reductase alpha subunit-like flavoprotein
MIPAFSRETGKKVYVQHVIKDNSKIVSELIRQGAYIFIAGVSKQMPQSVEKSILECLVKEDESIDAASVLKEMKLKKRFYVEAW